MTPTLIRAAALLLALSAPLAAQTTTPQAAPAVPSAEAAQLAPVDPAPGAPATSASPAAASAADAAPLATPAPPEAAQAAQELRAAPDAAAATAPEGGTAAAAQTAADPAPAAADAQAAAPADAKEREVVKVDYGQQKAVYHINFAGGIDGAGYKPALNNMQNHLDAVGDKNLDLRVVMHGDGLGLLAAARKDTKLQGTITDLKARGVRFLVCNNTLVGRNIDPETDLFDVWPEDIVQAGVAEVARLQLEGFAYIKP